MKRALTQALTALLGLLVLSGLLFAGAYYYRIEVLWAGALALVAQSLVVALAWWGLNLAKQQEELRDLPPIGSRNAADATPSGFRMSMGGDSGIAPPTSAENAHEARTLETSFQRVVVALTGVALLLVAAGIIFLLKKNFDWAAKNLDLSFPIAGPLGKPQPLDELSLLLGIGTAALYALLFHLSRVRRETIGYGEAVSGNFVMGLGGMAALAVAMVLAYMKITHASEIASVVIAGLLVLQGLELLANSLRSYSSLDEIDGNAVDLQALPLVPMLTSVWLGGLKMLFAQSLGLSREGQAGVIGRMMPRALLALVILAIAVSCVRVVGPGQVAVVERLGFALRENNDDPKSPVRILKSGLHFQLPWPIDELVYIPNERLEYTAIGAELHAPPGLADKVDFRFWRYRGVKPTESEAEEAEYITGDAGSPQLLETFISLWWRVKDPARFYDALSHSDFIEKSTSGNTKAVPIYEALIQQSAAYAVTQAFAIHTLDAILTSGRSEVSSHCMELLQQKLDQADSGIEVVSLVIKDVHPPVGIDEMPDPNAQPDRIRRGPAAAYEYVIASREIRERIINEALADQVRVVNEARGKAAEDKSQALKYKLETIARAQGEAAKFGAIFGEDASKFLQQALTAELSKQPGFSDLTPEEKAKRITAAISSTEVEALRRQRALYDALKEVLPRVNKVLVGPKVEPPEIWQTNEANRQGPRG